MRDVALAATAAPSYFPPVKIPMSDRDQPKGYVALIDGGVFANNPAPYALESASGIRPGSTEILLVSLGTGSVRVRMPFEEAKSWGLQGWAGPLLSIMFSDPGVEGSLRSVLPPDSYFRFQPDLGNLSGDLDDASPTSVRALKRLGEKFIAERTRDLNALSFRLKLPRHPDCPPPIGSDLARPQ